jgi:hypothetical protein
VGGSVLRKRQSLGVANPTVQRPPVAPTPGNLENACCSAACLSLPVRRSKNLRQTALRWENRGALCSETGERLQAKASSQLLTGRTLGFSALAGWSFFALDFLVKNACIQETVHAKACGQLLTGRMLGFSDLAGRSFCAFIEKRRLSRKSIENVAVCSDSGQKPKLVLPRVNSFAVIRPDSLSVGWILQK